VKGGDLPIFAAHFIVRTLMHSTIAAPELSIQFNRVYEFVRMGWSGWCLLSLGLGTILSILDHLEQVFLEGEIGIGGGRN
jgi:hypothetical protein